jgi:transposase InsO family protein
MDEQERDVRQQDDSGVPAGTPDAAAENVAGKQRRRRYTVEEKRALLDEFMRTGECVRDFCARRGVSTATLCKWRREHAAEGDAGLASRPNRRNHTGRTGRRATLVERKAAVEAFLKAGTTREHFARTWGISKQTLSAWLKAYDEGGADALVPKRVGRPRGKTRRTLGAIAQEILRIKQRFPSFGLRKVRDYLFRFVGIRVSKSHVRSTFAAAGVEPTPVVRKRHRAADQVRRFERARPGELWQSDITSFLLTRHSQRVYLTVFLDDHSRYVVSHSLRLRQTSELVTETLLDGIARFGKPQEVLTDQGRQYFAWRGKSEFEKLLAREGIKHVVARAHHPETVGKTERFWKTIATEFWDRVRPQDLTDARERLIHFVAHYNHFRPHQALGGLVPADRFFAAEDTVRKAIEQQLSQNELRLALEEAPRRPVFLFGQIGDRQVALHGERGKLVIQTPEGLCEELSLDSQTTHGGDGHGPVDAEHDGDSAAADAALPQADVPAIAPTGARGEDAVGASERGGEAAGASAGHDHSATVAGPIDQGAGDGGTRAASTAVVAIESAGALGDAGGPPQATTDTSEGSGHASGSRERPESPEEADRTPPEGECDPAGRERDPEDAARQPGEGGEQGGAGPAAEVENPAATSDTPSGIGEPSASGSGASLASGGVSEPRSPECSA